MKLKFEWLALLALPLMFFVACEDTDDDEAAGDSLIGTWSMSGTSYENAECTGDSEEGTSGTITFTDTKVTTSETETFEEWCDGTVADGVCDEGYGMTYEESEFIEECNDGGTYANNVCTWSQEFNYTYTDSLSFVMTEGFDMPESYSSLCVDEFGGTYANGVCTVTFEITMGVAFDGNTVTLTNIDVDEEDPEYSSCEVIVLTKQ